MFNKVIEVLLALLIGGSLAVTVHGLSVGNEEAAYAFGTLTVVNTIILFFRKTLNNV
jgi:hypothetical protein